jgi:chromate transport protein ChrA
MTPLVIDIIYIVLALGLLAGGWQQGFVKAAGSLVAFVVSTVISVWGITFLQQTFGWNALGNPITVLVLFLMLTLVISKLLGLFVWALDALRQLLSFIPLVGILNSFGGLLIGAVQVLLATAFLGWAIISLPADQRARIPDGSQALTWSQTVYQKTFSRL